MKTSIVIVDDHVLIAKALRSIISNFDPFEVLYECENGKELQEKLTSNKGCFLTNGQLMVLEIFSLYRKISQQLKGYLTLNSTEIGI